MLCPIFLEARPPGMRFEPTSFTVKAKDATTGTRFMCNQNIQSTWNVNKITKTINRPNGNIFQEENNVLIYTLTR